tara:strand:+ start:299 stop:595 length:297 start_codon:yes stop_codon:yes gene_type:complete
MKIFKSRFSKEFIKGLIEAFNGTEDVIVLTIPEQDEPHVDQYQKFYTAGSAELSKIEHNPLFPQNVEVRPYEELWIDTHRDKIEHLLLKKLKEDPSGN